MKTTWQQGMEIEVRDELRGEHESDVVIIGAGATGISTAYALAKAGKRVVVVDKATLTESVTAYTTAFLASDIDTDTPDLCSMFGKEKARDIWLSHYDAIARIEGIVKHEKINCEFMRTPEYFCATSPSGTKAIAREAKIVQTFGFDMDKVKTFAPGYDSMYELKNQAKFHPLKYFEKLRRVAEKLGVQFFEHSEVTNIKGKRNVTITTPRGTVRAKAVVIATYLPFENKSPVWPKKGMYVSYVYELAVDKGVLPLGLYIDDHNPYHYFRIDRNGERDRMIIGGEDRRKEIPIFKKKQFIALQNYMKDYFPDVRYTITTQWTGPILETIDGLPYIGRYSKEHSNRYVATGFSGNGMTYASIAASIITDIITGTKNPYTRLYDPFRRLSVKGLWIKTRDYIGEFVGGVLKNYFVTKK